MSPPAVVKALSVTKLLFDTSYVTMNAMISCAFSRKIEILKMYPITITKVLKHLKLIRNND